VQKKGFWRRLFGRGDDELREEIDQRMVCSSAFAWTFIGIAAGFLGSLAVTRSLRGLLFQVSERDLRTFLLTVSVLLSMALLSSWIPSRRAARIDAMAALRSDD
jgi:putative ABC transport system permease protein